MQHLVSFYKSIFFYPIVIALLLFAAVWYEMGYEALFLVVILSVLETTLSFDNAVVNAKILDRMDPVWQKRFLTWGILIAVFGTRFALPVLIVSVAVWTSPMSIAVLAYTDPVAYGVLLEGVHSAITAFGGVFLLMVSLKYFFDHAKSVHWIQSVESHLVRWGRIEAIEIAIALVLLLVLSSVTAFDQATVLVAGLIGLLLFIVMEGIASSLSVESSEVAAQGATLFVYLNVLDSAFSLDGVIGAFALSSDLMVIVIGLGIGAYFVRTLTVYFVVKKTLAQLKYLEHGAHWAIFGLAIAMLLGLVMHVPEIVTGLTGLFFVLFAYYSSIRSMKHQKSL